MKSQDATGFETYQLGGVAESATTSVCILSQIHGLGFPILAEQIEPYRSYSVTELALSLLAFQYRFGNGTMLSSGEVGTFGVPIMPADVGANYVCSNCNEAVRGVSRPGERICCVIPPVCDVPADLQSSRRAVFQTINLRIATTRDPGNCQRATDSARPTKIVLSRVPVRDTVRIPMSREWAFPLPRAARGLFTLTSLRVTVGHEVLI
ncbi:hypothetical protein CP556_20610 [Natrinema sp. CBA1119]|nr:hypothetical protein CP556_20610 [Natrinema sp. CBA1119]